jgi:putative tryptophan/tyrosine transport system substrate-binding protein
MIPMRRREFISLIGGAVAAPAWPLAARAQQAERMRRVGLLLPAAADDSEFQARVGAFLQGLQQSGWTIGRNVRIDTRWATTNAADIRRHAAELAALAPDVILTHGASTVGAMLQATRTVPIVFPVAGDPVAAGFVDSLGRPGGNATGFMTVEHSMGGKWLELLKQIASSVTRAAVIRDATTPSGIGQFGAIQTVAPSLGVEVRPVNVRDATEIARDVAAFTRAPNGGLISYGPDQIDQYRQAAGYVDRILKGEKPADLPVQTPTKYETVLNLKTAKTLGLAVPATVLARADEVLE